jgi:uncharacterized protein YpmB
MKKLVLILALVVAAGILFWAFRDVIGYAKDAAVKVKEADLPEAVRATLAKEAPGAKIEEIEKEMEKGKAVYEIEVEVDGKEYELEIAEDGTLLEKEADDADDDHDADDDEGDEEDDD